MDSVSIPSRDRVDILRQWLPVIAWGVVIFIFSSSGFTPVRTARMIEPASGAVIPGVTAIGAGVIHVLSRKLAHFIEYGVLYWLLVRGPMAERRGWALLICVIYALTDEGHQIFVPGRGPSLFDVGLDASGGLFCRYLLDFIREVA